MATTTNYGWTTPDDTALVKDGASAIRSLGSSIDTSIKSLNPGTTSGDIDYYTSSTAKTRLAKGTAGQVLTMNSGATAPEWATPTSGSLTQIQSITASNQANVEFTAIPATYKDLYVIIRNFRPATDGTGLIMRFNSDATANRHVKLDTYGTAVTNTFANTSAVLIDGNVDNGASTGLVSITFPDYTNTATWKMCSSVAVANDSTTATSARINVIGNAYNQTGAISSLLFLCQSGNVTSGTFILYGVK